MRPEIQTITVREFYEQQQNGENIELIDVRTPMEFQEVHIEFARNIPLDSLAPEQVTDHRDESAALYITCRSGSRGAIACKKFMASGFTNIVNIDGGVLAWEHAGFPVVRGRKIISLERQVRIAAGLLVLVGAALGLFIHQAFIGLSAFVGAGLVFAGVTDTCGMGIFLSRMPWNQVKEDKAACATN